MKDSIYKIEAITFRLDLKDPFLFTAHHTDRYPKGNAEMGPLTRDGIFNMYYGDVVPGFPVHPHIGFETITIVDQGTVDHFDSLGNSGRYSNGDVQWLTTGNGVQHSEMFPLIHQDKENPLEMFQIWLNSSPEQKKANPDYKMMWKEKLPVYQVENDNKTMSTVRIISGEFLGINALERPVNSWAYPKENKVNIFMITLEKGATLTIPKTTKTSSRFAYFYEGDQLLLAGKTINKKHLVEIRPDTDIDLKSLNGDAKILWLEGEPIGAPVVLLGPFVLNSDQEIREAFYRYSETNFGGWPWESNHPIFERDKKRFSSFKNDRLDMPE